MNQQINILHVISDFRRGGRERQLAILVKYCNKNIKHYIAVLNESKDSYIEEYGLDKPNYLGRGKIERIMNLYNYCKQNKISLIHLWGNPEVVYTVPISILLKIPILNGSIRHGVRKNTIHHRFRSLVLQNSNYVLGNSKAGFLANRITLKNNKHFVLYNGIEEKFFAKRNEERRREFLTKTNSKKASIIFISIANFIPYKDYFTVLACLKRLKNENLDFHFIAIGKGKQEEEIKDKITELHLEHNISIYNNNPNIPELLSISDILIHSSYGEGCSNAILEAKAAGLRVVASNTGGTNEIVSNEDYLFEYKNIDDLYFKIKSAIDSLNDNSISSDEIQKNTLNRFSVPQMEEKYSKILSKILK